MLDGFALEKQKCLFVTNESDHLCVVFVTAGNHHHHQLPRVISVSACLQAK